MRHFLILLMFLVPQLAQAQSVSAWAREFPKGDFSKAIISLDEIEFDGNTRDSIPPVFEPIYRTARNVTEVGDFEPVLSVERNGDARAYPLRIMLWHEIVNETIGGEPLLITYCPLCSSGVVYHRGVEGRRLTFGNSGRLRYLDMVMYDHQTESWWQQFSGRAVIGTLSGALLTPVPSRLESLADFRARKPKGLVLVPTDGGARPYGMSPFDGMDTRRASRRFSQWPVPGTLSPMDYVVVVGDRAWPLARIRKAGTLAEAGVALKWRTGRNSLHDDRKISKGRDLGSVEVTDQSGALVVHDLVFAFAFAAFIPDGTWMVGSAN